MFAPHERDRDLVMGESRAGDSQVPEMEHQLQVPDARGYSDTGKREEKGRVKEPATVSGRDTPELAC